MYNRCEPKTVRDIVKSRGEKFAQVNRRGVRWLSPSRGKIESLDRCEFGFSQCTYVCSGFVVVSILRPSTPILCVRTVSSVRTEELVRSAWKQLVYFTVVLSYLWFDIFAPSRRTCLHCQHQCDESTPLACPF